MRSQHSTRTPLQRAASSRWPALATLAIVVAWHSTPSFAEASIAPLQLPPDLINQVLEIDQTAQAHRDAAAPAAASSSTVVYIDNAVQRLQLLEITLQIDDAKPVHHTYGEAESRAMQGQAVHRLTQLALAPGPHKLYVESIARFPEDRPGTPRLRARVVQNFEQPASDNAIQATLTTSGWATEPGLVVRQWTPTASGLDEAELHAIDLFIATGRELRAASELLTLQRRNGASLPDAFGQRLAQSLAALSSPPVAADPGESALVAEYQAAAQAQDNAALDRIGRSDTTDAVALAIRDQANTSLGYALMQQQQNKAADEAFRRVRSPGPYSDLALLGLGWAQFTPGKSATASKPDAAMSVKTSIASSPSPFSSSWVVGDKDQVNELRRALVPWIELIGRDPTQAPVQEAMIAIPYALDHVGAHKQAQTYTLRAIDQLEHTRTQLENALADISSGRMAHRVVDAEEPDGNGWDGWYASLPEPRWWLKAPPDAPENFYVERLFDNADFRTQLQTCHRLHQLQLLLDQSQKSSTDGADPALSEKVQSLRPRLAALESSQRGLLAQIATAQVQAIRNQTERYLVEAHFAMARFNDRPPTALGSKVP